jgi:isoquinoline 1-oxidoreductase subunit alpha
MQLRHLIADIEGIYAKDRKPLRTSNGRKFMIKLKVNGAPRQFDGDPEMPLLWFLRDELNLKGTKFGCDMGMCGACTIHVNGNPARACLTPVSDAANKSVTTIEGLSAA